MRTWVPESLVTCSYQQAAESGRKPGSITATSKSPVLTGMDVSYSGWCRSGFGRNSGQKREKDGFWFWQRGKMLRWEGRGYPSLTRPLVEPCSHCSNSSVLRGGRINVSHFLSTAFHKSPKSLQGHWMRLSTRGLCLLGNQFSKDS